MLTSSSAMIHAFAAALSSEIRRRRAEFFAQAERFWEQAPAVLASQSGEGLGRRLRVLDGRLTLARVAGQLCVRAMDQAAWPGAELVAHASPAELSARVGLPPGQHAQALGVAQARTGVSLADARVRVGVTRGHLLAVVVEVPLDVAATPDALELAAETYVEVCLGDDVSDQWLVSIDTVRSPRQRSMLRVADVRSATAETYPLLDLTALVQRAIQAIVAECPSSALLRGSPPWTALELGEALEEGPQSDRQFVSTTCPEALKAVLEGLPFDSRRFTRGEELLLWFKFVAPGHQRADLRARAERLISEGPPAGPDCSLAGTGFGAAADYLDLWVPARPEAIRELGMFLSRGLGLPLAVGFYDSRLSGPELWIEPSEAAGAS